MGVGGAVNTKQDRSRHEEDGGEGGREGRREAREAREGE